MKLSINHIRRMNESNQTTGDIAAIGVDALIEKIGAQLGAIDEVIDIGSKYQGAMLVKVVRCEKHPNADRLNVCAIDDGGTTQDVTRGDDGYVQVVCGASNVRAGMQAVWLPPGATVPETADKDPFVLEAREIRGVTSNGMLASPKELALGDSHAGILEVPGDFPPGSDFAEVFNFKDDLVLDIENKMFTHRPDLFGWLGISRELAGIQGMAFRSPDWYTSQPDFPEPEGEALPLSVQNELPELVPRFTAIAMGDVQVGPSNAWVQAELAKHGMKPINNIVDYTNFFMMVTGQPLHAYDYDKVKALSQNDPTIVIRHPRGGEKVTLLNGKEIEPRAEAIMIATDKELIGIGGVMGGQSTEVDENTKNIILEVASFDMYSIRRTSMAHGLFTDAVTRFTKGQSPLQNLAVLHRIVTEIVRSGVGEEWGTVASQVIDDNHLDPEVLARNSLYPPVQLNLAFINDRLGLDLSLDEVQQLLQNVEFDVQVENESLTVTAPFWRTDIELADDVVEEVGRLYGYDKLPLVLPKRQLSPTRKDPQLTVKARVRDALSRAGANELLTYSFVHANLLNKAGQDTAEAFQLSNAISPDLQYYRLSLTPSLLEKVHPNIKAGYDQFSLFEIGKVHGVSQIDEEGVPAELGRVALVFAADAKIAKRIYDGAPYYQARKYLENLLRSFGITDSLRFVPLAQIDLSQHAMMTQMLQPYEASRSAVVFNGERIIGVIGEWRQSVRQALKLPAFSAGFEIFLSGLMAPNDVRYVPLPRYPKVTQDMTLKVPAGLAFQDLYEFVWSELNNIQPPNTLPELTPIDIYHPENADGHKHITLRLSIASYERTLTDNEVNKLLDTIAQAAHEKFGAERI